MDPKMLRGKKPICSCGECDYRFDCTAYSALLGYKSDVNKLHETAEDIHL
jgi:primosomal protein N'